MAQRYETENIRGRGRDRSREESWRNESEWRGNRESQRHEPNEDWEERYGRRGGDGGNFAPGYGYDYETMRRGERDPMEQERYRSGYGGGQEDWERYGSRPGREWGGQRSDYDQPRFSQSRGIGDRLFGASNYNTSPQDFGRGVGGGYGQGSSYGSSESMFAVSGNPYSSSSQRDMGQYGRGNWGQGYGEGQRSGFGQGGGQYGQSSGQYGQSSGQYGQSSGQYGQSYGQESQQQGQYSGRGPKGYKRSDDRIQEEINEALTQHPDIDPGEIEVKVKDGEVTLSGTVENRRDKRMAEDIAERCSGVNDVRNEIRVQHNGRSGSENQSSQHTQTQHGKSAQGSGSKMPESKTA